MSENSFLLSTMTLKNLKERILLPEDNFLAQLTKFYHEKGENASRFLMKI